jgi:hypothetical protein
MTAPPSRAIVLILSSGETAALTYTDGDHTSLVVPKAFPHGSTVSAQIAGSEFNLEVKVFRCQRSGGSYRVDGRVKNASRALRSFLLAGPPREETRSGSSHEDPE